MRCILHLISHLAVTASPQGEAYMKAVVPCSHFFVGARSMLWRGVHVGAGTLTARNARQRGVEAPPPTIMERLVCVSLVGACFCMSRRVAAASFPRCNIFIKGFGRGKRNACQRQAWERERTFAKVLSLFHYFHKSIINPISCRFP